MAAQWIVGLYLMLDLLQGSLIGSVGVQAGVAYFAHVGGGFSAVVICLLLRIQPDTEAMSEAKALQADMKDLALMPLHALQTMLEQEPTNPDIIRALTNAAMQQNMRARVDQAMLQAGPALLEKDPQFVGYYLTSLNGSVEPYSAVHLLRLAGQLERMGDPPQAVAIYQQSCNTIRRPRNLRWPFTEWPCAIGTRIRMPTAPAIAFARWPSDFRAETSRPTAAAFGTG